MDNEYVLYCNPSAILKEHPCNSGIYEALKRTEELSRQGVKVRLVDAAQMTEGDRFAVYVRATTPAMKNHNPIRQVFGSRKHSASMFGLGVPALLVETQLGEVLDVFPHKESERIVTINDFLSSLPVA
jgi:hypothetical protein